MDCLRLQPPGPFNFKNPDKWPRWKRQFEQFRQPTGLSDEAGERQVSTLLYCLGEEAEDILLSTSITANTRREYDEVLAKFDEFFKVRRNIVFERARFNQRNQQQNESAEEYIAVLYNLAGNCEYGTLLDEIICDCLVVGIQDSRLSEQLQTESELTLEKAKKIGRHESELTLEKAKKIVRQKEAVHGQKMLLKTESIKTESDIEAVQNLQRKGKPIRMYARKDTSRKQCERDLHSRDKMSCHHMPQMSQKGTL